jgi:fumarate reductase flavoprotein subunit
MTSTQDRYDLIIVGAGLAGLVAANRAAELGLKPLVLEKGHDALYLCNSRFTGGFFHLCFEDLHRPPEVLKDVIRRRMRGVAREELIEAVANDANRAVEWLRQNGAQFVKSGSEGWKNTVLYPVSMQETGLHWEGRGGDVLLQRLGASLSARGGVLQRGVCAKRLVMEDGCCVGVEVEGTLSGTLRAKAIVLADGGFQADLDRLRQGISSQPELLVQRNAKSGSGDGARMAQAVGAMLVNMDSFYGHLLHIDAMQSDQLWPYPMIDWIATSALLVNGQGERFCDEDEGGVFLANAVAKSENPLGNVVIFDEAIWQSAGRLGMLPCNPHLEQAGAQVITAPDLATLADTLNMPLDKLQATVEAFNAACRDGSFENLVPPRSAKSDAQIEEGERVLGKSGAKLPIAVAPFRAIRVVAGITYTTGGVLTDHNGHVLDLHESLIPGLFAAGSTTGGLEGGAHAGYTGGLSKTAVFALRAAEEIAKECASGRSDLQPQEKSQANVAQS